MKTTTSATTKVYAFVCASIEIAFSMIVRPFLSLSFLFFCFIFFILSKSISNYIVNEKSDTLDHERVYMHVNMR